jgi:hypothetical protein
MTRLRLLRLMRITQLVLVAAGVLVLVLGAPILGLVAVAVGVGAFVVSGTDWYRAIYFERPVPRAPVCTHATREARRMRVH